MLTLSPAIEDFTLDGVRSSAASITQCTTFSGTAGDCDSSKFVLENITIQGFTGTIDSTYVANMQCSEDSGGCQNIEFEDIDLTDSSSGDAVADYKCSNVESTIGFEC
jgi:galacturan 1,4-alpha-galacturonidase